MTVVNYLDFYTEHIKKLKHESGDEYKGICPFHEDKNPSFSINTKTGQYQCFSCGAKGNLITFCKKMKIPIPGQQAKKQQAEPEATFDYQDEKGELLYQVCRFPGKKFLQRKPDGNGGWIWKTKGVKKIPYRLPKLLKADPDEWIFIPEGEKHVDQLYKLGLIATCNAMGAGKWTSEISPYLKDRRVCILPDNDDPGQGHGQKIAHNLLPIAKEVRVLNLPDLPPKGDILNWLEAGHDKNELLRLVNGTPSFSSQMPEACKEAKQEKKDPAKDQAFIDEMNKEHAVICWKGKAVILNEEFDPIFNRPDISFSSPYDFKILYLNRFTSDKKSLSSFWLCHPGRREYKGIVFAPKKDVPGYYNLWRGFSVKPRKGDCSFYLDHIKNIICNGNEEYYDYLISLLADSVQNPDIRPGVSVVLRGAQGTGKGIFIKEYGKLFGKHFTHVSSSKQFVGNFNAHLKDILILYADEAFWAGDKEAEGTLKRMITEETLVIEPKGKDAFTIPNLIRVMISSNHDWVVPAGLEERRFFILDVGNSHIQDHVYFGKLYNQLNEGGREALLYYLLHYDLAEKNLRAIPQTEALEEMKKRSMTPIQSFWYSKLDAGALFKNMDKWSNEPVSSQELFQEYLEVSGQEHSKSKHFLNINFGKDLQKYLPDGYPKTSRPRSNEGKQYKAYLFPSLQECREHWDKLSQSTHKWPEEGTTQGIPF